MLKSFLEKDFIITKGDQYDVRESINNDNNAIDVNNNIKVTRKIRNFGKPVDLAQSVFVPLTIGGKVSISSDAVYAIEKYLNNGCPEETTHHMTKTKYPGPNKEIWCWYQCTVKGGNVYQLATICEIMGAGGTNSGMIWN
nr:15392_t:CDS:2 [Entrophospora candida]